ncbi:hypothetical protein AnigIFM63604_008095 [Aspergillus niger]|uniref:Uncharacterized protein n=1 Tax=Aspergillus niger TaxID=5061 RepID=A0A9W6A485_ASPNG|nr:hypothetical protein AnigIFM63604_008095 [Aspergillus niger]
MTLSGQVVVVAGASKGIGRAIVLRAAAAGASVVINYMSDVKGANSLVAQVGSDRAFAVRADISKIAEIDELIKATVARFGRIDVLIPNAAYVPSSDLRNVTEEEFELAFAVNVKGPCFLAKKALPYMQPGSNIIFISTDLTDASSVPAHFLLYTSAKAAMNQMVKVLARDLAHMGIRVNAISPGATSTESFHRAHDDTRAQMIASHNPFNRIGEPDEIAAAENRGYLGKVLEEYLYSGEAPLVNGYTGGLGHPFIHLAYAYEFRSEEVATQALNQGCTMYNALHTLLDQAPPDSSKYKTGFLAVVFESVRQDPRLDGLFREPGINNIDLLSQEQNLAVVLEKWNAWEVINPLAQLEESCDLAVLLALSNGNPRDSFDFFNVHIMTVAYALRVLWHYFPTSRRVSILEQYALFGIMTYICQLRPQFSLGWI